MLTLQERRDVEEAFAHAAAGQLNPKDLVPVIFKAEASQILLQPASSSTVPYPDQFASFVVGYSLASRWSCTPPLLDLLLDYLIQSKGRGEFVEILARVRRKEDPNPSPYDCVWLFTRRPFFDRAELRDRVRCLVEENARPLLRLTPQQGSYGRSYSRQFLEHLEELSPRDWHVVSEVVSDGCGPTYEIADLAEGVGLQLGVTEAIPEPSGSSYPNDVARWMLKHVMSKSDRWIIVLDGFGQRGLSDDVHQAIDALAMRIASGQPRRKVRLVLLDYQEPLPSVSSADILEELLHPATQVSQADLEPCIETWDAEQRKSGKPGLRPEEIGTLAARMIGRAPAEGKERLVSLNEDLMSLWELA
jgi:hypothetical protein